MNQANRKYRCWWCAHFVEYNTRAELHVHKTRSHPEWFGAGMQEVPWDVNNPNEDPFAQLYGSKADGIRDIYFNNAPYILRDHQTVNPMIKIFNFPIPNGVVTNEQIEAQMRYIYEHEDVRTAYRVNIASGTILMDKTNQNLRYFRPAANALAFDQPKRIWNRASLNQAIREIQEMEFDDYIRSYRPSSNYQVLFITNLEYHIFTSNYPLRGPLTLGNGQNLPPFVKNNKAIVTSFDNSNYDNCCVFIAIAQHRNPDKDPRRLTAEIKSLFNQWVHYHNANHPFEALIPHEKETFKGIFIQDIAKLQVCFEMNINVMEIRSDGSVTSEFNSATNYKDTMYLNLYKSHVNLIRVDKLDIYAKSYVCR